MYCRKNKIRWKLSRKKCAIKVNEIYWNIQILLKTSDNRWDWCRNRCARNDIIIDVQCTPNNNGQLRYQNYMRERLARLRRARLWNAKKKLNGMAYCVISRWNATATTSTTICIYILILILYFIFIFIVLLQKQTSKWANGPYCHGALKCQQRAQYEHNIHIIGPEYYDDHDEFAHFSTRLLELVPLSNHANTLIIMITVMQASDAHCSLCIRPFPLKR